jgi:hypothetical protein
MQLRSKFQTAVSLMPSISQLGLSLMDSALNGHQVPARVKMNLSSLVQLQAGYTPN